MSTATDKNAGLSSEAFRMVQGFAYKLNAMEGAAMEPVPADHQFSEKREAVLDTVRGLAGQLVVARDSLASALAGVEHYRAAANEAYEHRFGISYDEMRTRIARVQEGEYVTHEEVMRRVRAEWKLPAKEGP